MNPFDELSVEESVRIREKNRAPGGVEDICVFSAGPPKAQDVLRTAMAMGADRAIHVDVKEGEDLEPLTVAKLLKAAAEQQKSNLVILGKQSIDDDANQTGQMLAGLLGWPQATQASKVEFGEGDSVSVTREVDGGVETVRAKLPMIITTDLRLNEPRYASLPNIMKAKKKPLEKKTLADFGISAEKRLKVLKVTGELALHVVWLTLANWLCRTPCEARRRQGRGCGRSHLQAQGARRYLECCIQAKITCTEYSSTLTSHAEHKQATLSDGARRVRCSLTHLLVSCFHGPRVLDRQDPAVAGDDLRGDNGDTQNQERHPAVRFSDVLSGRGCRLQCTPSSESIAPLKGKTEPGCSRP